MMRRMARIDDPNSGGFYASQIEFIQRLGGAGSIPFSAPEHKCLHNAQWDEDYRDLMARQILTKGQP